MTYSLVGEGPLDLGQKNKLGNGKRRKKGGEPRGYPGRVGERQGYLPLRTGGRNNSKNVEGGRREKRGTLEAQKKKGGGPGTAQKVALLQSPGRKVEQGG